MCDLGRGVNPEDASFWEAADRSEPCVPPLDRRLLSLPSRRRFLFAMPAGQLIPSITHILRTAANLCTLFVCWIIIGMSTGPSIKIPAHR